MEENLILPLSNYAVELAKKNELIAAAKSYNFIFDYCCRRKFDRKSIYHSKRN